MENKIDCIEVDVLVVGAGLAGLKVTNELIENNVHTLLVTKTILASGSSFYPLKASLGTQVTRDDSDQSIFMQDIKTVNREMGHPELDLVYVQNIADRVKEYESIGVDATKLSGDRKACFAEHSRDIYLLKDWNQIRTNVKKLFTSNKYLQILENTSVMSIVKKDQRVVGAFLLDKDGNDIYVATKAIILASGGFGSIYKHNLNPNDVDGSGHILALEAGAELVNMEFIQFIPGITSPKYKTLFGEQTLVYCTDLVDEEQNSIIDEFLPDQDKKREMLNIRSSHGPFTSTFESKYFDIALMKKIIKYRNEKGYRLVFKKELYSNEEEFYTVYLNWLQDKGVNLIRDDVYIAPFAHASNGGVKIDSYGRTSVPGLYAIGELAATVEGANRLGGVSTGGCIVFGKRAAVDCQLYIKTVNQVNVHVDDELEKASQKLLSLYIDKDNADLQKNDDWTQSQLNVHEIIEKVREIMWIHGNVVRTEKGLLHALQQIAVLKEQFLTNIKTMKFSGNRKGMIRARNFLILSELLLTVMLERKESRGAHYRDDFPVENADYSKRLHISIERGKIACRFQNNK